MEDEEIGQREGGVREAGEQGKRVLEKEGQGYWGERGKGANGRVLFNFNRPSIFIGNGNSQK